MRQDVKCRSEPLPGKFLFKRKCALQLECPANDLKGWVIEFDPFLFHLCFTVLLNMLCLVSTADEVLFLLVLYLRPSVAQQSTYGLP